MNLLIAKYCSIIFFGGWNEVLRVVRLKKSGIRIFFSLRSVLRIMILMTSNNNLSYTKCIKCLSKVTLYDIAWLLSLLKTLKAQVGIFLWSRLFIKKENRQLKITVNLSVIHTMKVLKKLTDHQNYWSLKSWNHMIKIIVLVLICAPNNLLRLLFRVIHLAQSHLKKRLIRKGNGLLRTYMRVYSIFWKELKLLFKDILRSCLKREILSTSYVTVKEY